MTTQFNNSAGFTLIEALVALVLLSLALTPALYVTNFMVGAAAIIRDDTTAANLTQEGIEVIRAIRDTNWFNGRPYDNGLGTGTWRVEYNSDALLSLGSNPPLKIGNGIYNYTVGTDTTFHRTIAISKTSAMEIKVVSTVTWTAKGNNPKSISAEDHLFDWK